MRMFLSALCVTALAGVLVQAVPAADGAARAVLLGVELALAGVVLVLVGLSTYRMLTE